MFTCKEVTVFLGRGGYFFALKSAMISETTMPSTVNTTMSISKSLISIPPMKIVVLPSIIYHGIGQMPQASAAQSLMIIYDAGHKANIGMRNKRRVTPSWELRPNRLPFRLLPVDRVNYNTKIRGRKVLF